MAWQEEDRTFLGSAADELTEYLATSVYEWPLSSSRISLTPGRVLFSLTRCSVLITKDTKLAFLAESINRIIQANKIQWCKKMAIEFPRRLKVWENAVNDYFEEGLDKSYTAQVAHRVILRLLEMESLPTDGELANRLEVVDKITKKIITAGDFIWDDQLLAVFDEKDYWFLYCKPVKG